MRSENMTNTNQKHVLFCSTDKFFNLWMEPHLREKYKLDERSLDVVSSGNSSFYDLVRKMQEGFEKRFFYDLVIADVDISEYDLKSNLSAEKDIYMVIRKQDKFVPILILVGKINDKNNWLLEHERAHIYEKTSEARHLDKILDQYLAD